MAFFSSAFLSVSKERETVELEKKNEMLCTMAADVVLVI
jgi:hypothetical protein